MKFGAVPVSDAVGAILAHSERVAGRKLPKGTRLTEAHVTALAASGLSQIVVARLSETDVHEDIAAARLAAAVQPAGGFETGKAATGRVNLRASQAGLVWVDPQAILAVNSIDPGITIATVPPFQRLDARGLAATIKIIPYAVAEADLQEACRVGAQAMRLLTPTLRSATLIETRVDAAVPSDKGRRAIKTRLDRMGVALTERVIVPHDESAIAEAVQSAPGDLVMILTGSATSDVRDTAPSGLVRAGGEVVHYGMPVDPGNLLFVGKLAARSVIGLPGCARSPALNGADWVLERVLCGVPVEARDIAAMGVGGLLKEIPTRPRPRETKR